MPPRYSHPGVYVQELPSTRPITRIGTNLTAFIGACPDGPRDEPIQVTSYSEYCAIFTGVASAHDSMGLAVQAYFLNRGQAAYICNVCESPALAAWAEIKADRQDDIALTLTARTPGFHGNNLLVRVTRTEPEPGDYVIEISRESAGRSDVLERLGVARDAASATASINKHSTWISAVATGERQALLPAGQWKLAGGQDPEMADADRYDSFMASALSGLPDISILVLPGATWGPQTAIIRKALDHCETLRDRMLILDLPETARLEHASDVQALALPNSAFACLYYPWVELDPNCFGNNIAEAVSMAPSAFAAGIWARTDITRDVWKAPAGTSSNLTGVVNFLHSIDDDLQGILNPLGINCLRRLPHYGPLIWGARTLAGPNDLEWRYIPVRRTAIMIEQSIARAFDWFPFEPDAPSPSAITDYVEDFLGALFRQGAFQGSSQNEAYFVSCGPGKTMTQTDVDQGRVIVEIGVALYKPAEFVLIRIEKQRPT